MTRYEKLKIEKIVNNALYRENVIDKRIYDKMEKKLEKLLFEESNKNDLI